MANLLLSHLPAGYGAISVVRHTFMCFGGVDLEGVLKGGGEIFSVGYFQNLAWSCLVLRHYQPQL